MKLDHKVEYLKIHFEKIFERQLDNYTEFFHDYDGCRYELRYDNNNQQIFFSFASPKFKEIFGVAGKDMLNKYYADFNVQQSPEPGYDLSLTLSTAKLPQPTIKKTKDMSEEDRAKWAAEREECKKAEKEFFDKYGDAISAFRRNFYGSPIEIALDKYAKGGANEGLKLEYVARDGEAIWILPSSENIGIYYAFNFLDSTDVTIAKLILQELVEAKRHIKNSPSAFKSFEDQVPDVLTKAFPGSKLLNAKYSNGIVGISLFPSHIKTNFDNCISILQGFRQYIHYHVDASKTYMHGRIRKRVAALQRVINHARFEEEGKKVYRSMKGKNIEVNAYEEEKGPQTLLIKKK